MARRPDPRRPEGSGGGLPPAPFFGLLALPRRLAQRRVQPARVLPWLLLICFAVVTAYYVVPRPKSFFLDVSTDILQVTTDADTQIVWEVSEVAICQPRHRVSAEDAAATPPPSEPACDPRAYVESAAQDMEIDWPENTSLTLRAAPRGALDVLVRLPDAAATLDLGEVTLVHESLLRIPHEALDTFGGLAVTGRLRIGQIAENGTHDLLRSGRYETREKFLLARNARLVDSGAFSLGDVVSIVSADEARAPSTYAFVTPGAARPGDPAAARPLRIVATSEEAHSRLRLERARARATYLEPGWAQRLSSDPLAIGFATLLSLFGATLAVMNAFVRRKD